MQGLSKFVTCFYGDAYANCFSSLPHRVDAVFLDLPKPWCETGAHSHRPCSSSPALKMAGEV